MLACAPAPEFTTVPLARRSAAEVERTEDFALMDGRRLRFVVAPVQAWLEMDVARQHWSPSRSGAGLWRTSLPIRGRGQPPDRAPPARLQAGVTSYEYVPGGLFRKGGPESLTPGSFTWSGSIREKAEPGELILRLESGTEPPAEATFAVYVSGYEEGETQHVGGRRFTGEAIAVWRGHAVEKTAPLPPASALRFATVLEPALVGPPRGKTTFRVMLDDELIFEDSYPAPRHTAFRWHEVVLPTGGRDSARFRFEVAGPPSHAAFFNPRLGPSEVGRYGERPWGDARPDIVVFLADTFRADNMAAYGGELGITPHLDRLAEQSVLFERAWSVSTYTAPAHASMFSGLYPPQTSGGLHDEVATIAERLGRAGYRTGAITDAGMVSRTNGMHQGFEWFDERHHSLESTLQRAQQFLDADDGRPVFLFVHTYRTHTPYVVSSWAQRLHRNKLRIDWNYDEVMRDWRDLIRDERGRGGVSRQPRRQREILGRLLALYRGSAADLDRGWGAFHEALVANGVLDNGYLVFTSDHGEAFYEHGRLSHSGPVWEEMTRVPLLIAGSGLEPRRVWQAASLIDLSPTLADMAGIEPAVAWPGKSLLGPTRDGPAFLYENHNKQDSTLAIVEGSRKVIGFEDPEAIAAGEVFAAFDLAEDPTEQRSLADSDASWPAELLQRLGPQAASYLVPRIGPRAELLDDEKIMELKALGYLAD